MLLMGTKFCSEELNNALKITSDDRKCYRRKRLCNILPPTFRENSNGSKNKGKHKNEGKY